MWIYWERKWKKGGKKIWVLELESIGKGTFMPAVSPANVGCLRTGLGPETHVHQELKSPHGPCWVYHLAWNILPCFRFHVFSTVLLKWVQCMVPGQSPRNSCSCRERRGSFCYRDECMQASCSALAVRGTRWPWRTPAHYRTGLAVSLPYTQSSALLDDSNWDAVGKSVFELLTLIKQATDATGSTGSNNSENYQTFVLLVM